jgi:hypothetical protein
VSSATAALLLAVLATPASAQLVGGSDPWNPSVYAPPNTCNFTTAKNYQRLGLAIASIPDTPPVSRSVVRTNPPVPQIVADAPVRNARVVSFSYTFTRLDLTLPTDFAGLFVISKTEVTVFKGPEGQAVASAIVDTDPAKVTHPAWTNATTETRSVSGSFFSTWDITVLTSGTQYATSTSAGRAASVKLICHVPVGTLNVPPVFQLP